MDAATLIVFYRYCLLIAVICFCIFSLFSSALAFSLVIESWLLHIDICTTCRKQNSKRHLLQADKNNFLE